MSAPKIHMQQVQGLEKMRKQFSALYTLLIQKGILTEDEIQDVIDSIELIDTISKNI